MYHMIHAYPAMNPQVLLLLMPRLALRRQGTGPVVRGMATS